MADKTDYGWKTVGEYLDNELADDDRDAKKIKKAKQEAQRKIAESRAAKAAKARLWFMTFRNPTHRSPGNTIANSSPSPSPFSLSVGNYSPRFSSSTGGRSKRHTLISIFKWDGSKTRAAHALAAVNQVIGGMNVLCRPLPEYNKKEKD